MKGALTKTSNSEWFSCVGHGSSWSLLKNLRACVATSHSCHTFKIICSPTIKSRYTNSKEMVKASTTSKGILLSSCQLLKLVATLLKVLIAQELIIQCDFDLHESHTFNHTHICNIAHAHITCSYIAPLLTWSTPPLDVKSTPLSTWSALPLDVKSTPSRRE